MVEHDFFDIEQVDDVTVVRLTGVHLTQRLLSGKLRESLLDFVRNQQPAKLLVSFAAVKRISSETINALIRTREQVLACKGTLRLCDMRPEIRQAFTVLNLDGTLFQIHDTEAEAREAFAAS